MGAFNTLKADIRCPVCSKDGVFEVQFKYGDTWQHEYHLGDHLRWGGNDVGDRSDRVARVEAIGGPCPHCSTDYLTFTVIVEDNVLTRVERAVQ